MTLYLDDGAYREYPEDTPQTPMRSLRHKTPDTSPLKRRHYEQNILAQHSSKSWDHYTPADIVSKVKEVLGDIDLDPASSWLAQKTVQANQWFGLRDPSCPEKIHVDDGLAVPWYGTVYLNPPGGNTCLVRPELSEISRSYPVVWWLKLCSEYMCGNVTSAIYMGFSLEQMASTQLDGTPSILDFPFCVPSKRLCFDYPADTREGKPIATSGVVGGKQPTHSNVIVYLPPRRTEPDDCIPLLAIDRLKEVFSPIGKVVVP